MGRFSRLPTLRDTLLEEHVLAANPPLLAMGRVQIAVAARDIVGGRIPLEPRRTIDPSRTSFKLQKVSDRRLVQQHFARVRRLRILGPKLFVLEHWMVTDVRKNLFHERAERKVNFKLRTLLVSARLRRPLVRQHAVPTYAAYTDQFAMPAKSALRIVQQDVGFEHTGLRDAEAQLAELLAHLRHLAAQTQLDLDFNLQCNTLRHHRARCQLKISKRDASNVTRA